MQSPNQNVGSQEANFSSPSTAEFRPPQDLEGPKSPGVFARLTPHNATAWKAFRSVVDAVKRDPTQFGHHCRFLHYDEPGMPLSSLLTPQSSTSLEGPEDQTEVTVSTSSDDQHTQRPSQDELVYNGHYLLSLDTPPLQPELGWRIGTGRWSGGSLTGGVDLLLNCQPPFMGHASVMLDMCMILRSDGTRGLTKPVSFIQIGDLLYKFAYSNWAGVKELVFQKEKVMYFRQKLGAAAPMESTSATPSLNAIAIGNWSLHRTVGGGAFGVVNATSLHGGKLKIVAFKEIVRRNNHSNRIVDSELQAALTLKAVTENHDCKEFIIRLEDVIYERGSSVFDYSGPERVYFLYSPLARGTFGSHLISNPEVIPMSTRISLLTDVIKGLICLHDISWIHRDIKPDNLAVVTMGPPRAVVGQACYSGLDPEKSLESNEGIEAKPGTVGTPLYLAPEMEWHNSHYGPAVDIYSLGLVAYQLFVGPHPLRHCKNNPWLMTKNNRAEIKDEVNRWNNMLEDLNAKVSNHIEHLIANMLTWNKDSRCSARQALEHPSLIQDDKPNPKRARV
ncbi:serine/threonine protein kinase [Polytolypa hystricis UAMH7299]|uniref:Serine/threonine protein kinase n=1 Tax=Polytolypa hystricis (strain UAMH7299) TaxID=1447883 RepID=A0A2B7WLM0_POLH7|nr:serine/threonine protein kinase [Polytolypa hystricis UAMH7299]